MKPTMFCELCLLACVLGLIVYALFMLVAVR